MEVESFIYNYRGELKFGFQPNLVFLFFEGQRKEVVLECYKKLKQISPKVEVVGVNGKGGNLNNNIPFITNENQVSILAFNIENFLVRVFNIHDKDILKKEFTSSYYYYRDSASILFFPFEYDTNSFLDYIQDEKNMHNIYGGVYTTSNDVGVFYNGQFYRDRLISVFFNQDEVEFFSLSIHGWKPIGISFKVTKSEKNIVYSLDDEPALKLIEEYIGEIKQENIDIFLHPFCVKHKDDISLASIKSINRNNNSIEFYKYIYEGEEIKITIPINQQKMMKLIEQKLKDIKCKGLFVFSCIGRYAYYKELLVFEMAEVSDFLKVPFAGFLTYGEIGSNKVDSKSILQNQTMNLIFFKDK